MIDRIFQSSRNLPEMVGIPSEQRFEVYSLALQRAHRHWQIWLTYTVYLLDVGLIPNWHVHFAHISFSPAHYLYLMLGMIACRAVTMHYARRYIAWAHSID